MIRPWPHPPEVLLCLQPVDFRKGMAALAALAAGELGQDPFAPRLFVFINRHRTGIKLLYWDRTGFCLWHKKLEQERFHWLKRPGDAVTGITLQQLEWLLDGYDIARMKAHQELKYSCVS